jgi:glucokinase
VKELADIADHDPVALGLFEEYGTGMGRFLAPWIRQFKAEAIVIGGNITGAFHLFGKPLLEALKIAGPEVPVFLSELKEDAAVLGSARLLVDNYWDRIKGLLAKM